MIVRAHVLVLIITVISASFAAAQPQPNVITNGDRWIISGYDDASPMHAASIGTHTLCFVQVGMVGTHYRGVWFSPSFKNWRGRFSQEGDRVVMHGEVGERTVHNVITFDLFAGSSPTPADEGAGEWTEWFESGDPDLSVFFANARLRRDGYCQLPPGLTKLRGAELDKAIAELAAKVPQRLKADGTPARSPLEAGQAPINK